MAYLSERTNPKGKSKSGIEKSLKIMKSSPSAQVSDEFFDNQDDEWLTSAEAAAFLKISESSLMNMCSNGSIPYYKLERRNRYRLSDLRDLLLKTKKGGY